LSTIKRDIKKEISTRKELRLRITHFKYLLQAVLYLRSYE